MSKMMHNRARPYLRRREGVYYFVRRVPADVRDLHSSDRISMSLRTRHKPVAERAAQSLAQRLKDYWVTVRLQRLDLPSASILPVPNTAAPQSEAPTISQALSLYMSLKGVGKGKQFRQTAERNIGYVVEKLGDRPVDCYNAKDAAQFRDWLMGRGMTVSSVKRVFATVRAAVSLVTVEHGLECTNAFKGTFMPEPENKKRRKPVPLSTIRHVQTLCRHEDDELRWIIALVSDTGMRLSEAVGLSSADIRLDADIPHIDLKAHPWRPLKTEGSERLIPLVGASLWAARRVCENSDRIFAFPRYADGHSTNANSASAALNKWLRERAPAGCVVHGFRHSLRDRLRAVECPSDIVDALGGWVTAGVGQGYGNGYPLEVLAKWMRRLT